MPTRTLLFVALCFFLQMQNAFAEDTNVVVILDPNVRAAIHLQLGVPEESSIIRSQMLALTSLSVQATPVTQITSLVGLEYATNLEWFAAALAQDVSMDIFLQMPRLRELVLDESQFRDVAPLLSLTNLRAVSLSQTDITNISSLSSHPTLGTLVYEYNGETNSQVFSGFSKLDWLALFGNPIRDVAVLGQMTNLIYLSLGGTPLLNPHLLTNNPNLQFLVLPRCNITDISFLGAMTNLEHLSLPENRVQDCTPLASLSKLSSFSAAHNLLTNLGPLLNCPLTYLDVTRNFLWNTNFGFYPPTISVIQAVQSRGGTALFAAQSLWGTISLSIEREGSKARLRWHRQPSNLPFRLQFLDEANNWHTWTVDDFSDESVLINLHPEVEVRIFRARLGFY